MTASASNIYYEQSFEIDQPTKGPLILNIELYLPIGCSGVMEIVKEADVNKGEFVAECDTFRDDNWDSRVIHYDLRYLLPDIEYRDRLLSVISAYDDRRIFCFIGGFWMNAGMCSRERLLSAEQWANLKPVFLSGENRELA